MIMEIDLNKNKNSKIEKLKNTLEKNPDTNLKFKTLILLIKENDKISIEKAKETLLPYIFKYNLQNNAEKLNTWLDKKIPLFTTKKIRHPMAIAGYKPGIWRRRGPGGALSMFPEFLKVDVNINKEELDLIQI
jgi:hypothetical protein